MKGRVALLKEYRKPLEIKEFDLPDPEPGAVVVKITAGGLCGSDLHHWRGDFPRPIPETGGIIGHEGVGVVHSLGKGVTTDFAGSPLKEGDRVIFGMGYTCNRCLYCLAGDHNLCPNLKLYYRNAGGEFPYFVSTFSDFSYMPPLHPIFKIPDELKDEEVVALNCALGTVFQGLRLANLRQGQTIVIQGSGGLGLYAAALASDIGANSIVAIDGQEPRLKMAQQLGATHTININEHRTPKERVERVLEITGRRGADLVVELVGYGELVAEGINMLARGGTFLEIGNLMPGRYATILPRQLLQNRKIIGSGAYRPSYIPLMLDFLVRNRKSMPLDKIISHRFSLANISEAFVQSEWENRATPVIRSAILP